MGLTTRLTERFGIQHPIVSAPMANVSGGRLAAAVSEAGGLGLIGGGYGDRGWLTRELDTAGSSRVGCGFITWSLASQPDLLDLVLAYRPAGVMLSFGRPQTFAAKIKAAGVRLICQVQCLDHAREAVDAGADVIVAQGTEAGGHGMVRSTMTLVPETADYLAGAAPDTVLLAAGGIADGRGLAAALMLGADGALIGSRFWASEEALVHPNLRERGIAATGDETIRTTVVDIVRELAWPAGFTARVVNNRFVAEWHGREAVLSDPSLRRAESRRYFSAMQAGDAENTGIWIGEAAGLVRSVRKAGDLVRQIAAEAERLLHAGDRDG